MDDIKKQIEKHKNNFYTDLESASNKELLEKLRIKYLARQGLISEFMTQLKSLPVEVKKEVGPLFNALKKETQEAYDLRQKAINDQIEENKAYKLKNFDVTIDKPFALHGTLHPYTRVIEELQDIFISMGYDIAQGPELETEFHNFDALNIPSDHPAREMQDTFWLTLPGLLMRTHTSTVQVHTMLNKKPPIAIIAPGRCYRNEATDASHDFMFMQFEGLLIDKNINLSNLFATVQNFLQAIFEKKNLDIRIRPSYFPFVEPGVEIDMTCPFCTQGCSTCKKTKWIEICGAGLVHPNVLKSCNINPEEYKGFAFGFGLTRLVMLKYGITDIRLLHNNKIEFLEQF